MFDVADALGALQQASSMPVEALSGTWYWTLAHMGQVYGDLLLEVMAMADATLQHVVKPTEASAAELLCKVSFVWSMQRASASSPTACIAEACQVSTLHCC